MKQIAWKSDTEFSLDGVNFKCVLSDYKEHKTSPEQVIIIKGRWGIELYRDTFRDAGLRNVFEFGVFEGGSPILLSLLFDLEKFVGIDIKAPVAGLDEFLARHPVGERIHLHYRVSQDDEQGTREIIEREFQDSPIDLIIDDASHQYEQSRRAFEISFPYLKPGGSYIIEDWGWAHWPWFDRWQDAPALSNLVFELVMACATSRDVISQVTVYPTFVFIQKSRAASQIRELKLEELYQARGKRLNLI